MTDRGRITIGDELLAAGFVQVPMAIVQAADLSDGAKLAYAHLLWYAWKHGEYPGHAQVAADRGTSERTVKRQMSELADAGYVICRRRGLGQTNEYFLPPLSRSAKSVTSEGTDMTPQMGHIWPENESEVVLDVRDEYESDSLWITSVAERYGTSRRDRAALRTSLSKYPVDAVKWAVEELQGGMAVKNPGAWLNVVVPELATQLDRRKREKISVQERRLIAVRSTYGFYLQANSPEKARALVETDFGVEAVRQALESAA